MELERILLVGANGMLGRAFFEMLRLRYRVVAISYRNLRSVNLLDMRRKILESGAKFVINCAADTDVEGAEANPFASLSANALLPELLAHSCRYGNVKLIHFSSTGCYGNYKNDAYCDYDSLHPTTAHHRAKLAGEIAVRTSGCDHLIFRLGWLFGGPSGSSKNFVRARLAEAKGMSEIFSDPNQIGNPTNVEDVVRQTIHLMDAGLSGTFNSVASEAVSRFDYVSIIIKQAGLSTKVEPRHFDRRAPVSSNESATNNKLDMLGLNIMPTSLSSLKSYVAQLLKE